MSEDRHSGVPGGNGSGANVKSGSVTLDDAATVVIVFMNAFSVIPDVVALLGSDINARDLLRVYNITTTGFALAMRKDHSGGNHTWNIHWIATDAGDP